MKVKGKKENGKSEVFDGGVDRPRVSSVLGFSLLLFTFSFLAGCTRDYKYQPLGMWNSARLEPMENSPSPDRLSSARVPPPGTVARGQYASFDPVNSGRSGGTLVTQSPIPINAAVLERGQQRFNVFCSPCHGRLGDGEGFIVKRGFPPPPDYAIRRLRQAPIGHFYDVITNGYGVMYSYAERVPVPDRWAIAAYIRVLQEARPLVADDAREQEMRRRARERGIQDPSRGMRLPPEEGAHGPAQDAPAQNAPAPPVGAGH
jgi:mono/diheme cytochrome c family protein